MKRRKQPEEWQAKLGVSGLNPLAVMDLQDAVRGKADRALLDGNWFNIKYIDNDTIFYSPEDSFSPCGYLKINRLLSGG